MPLLLTIILILSPIASTEIVLPPRCHMNTEINTICAIEISKLHPTQFSVGEWQVYCEIEDIHNYWSSCSDIVTLYKQINPPVVLLNDSFYVLDNHHFLRSLYEINNTEPINCPLLFGKDPGERFVFVKLVGRYGKQFCAEEQFFEHMLSKHHLFPYHRGMHVPPALLPSAIADLRDDHYRSLAFIVRQFGGFSPQQAKNVYYAEFRWAQFFRERLKLPKNFVPVKHYQIVLAALELAHSSAASWLPGYTRERFPPGQTCCKVLRELQPIVEAHMLKKASNVK
ncbi:hypothetical protein P9112_001747 [Eukaryota sp. TZLM1-RC]